MKNKFKNTICFILAVILICSITVFPISALGGEDQILPMATCSNHQFTVVKEAYFLLGWHVLGCANAGCTATLREDCYAHVDCSLYQNVETLSCQGCNETSVYIHNYEYYHDPMDSDSKHQLTCTNYGSTYMMQCGKTKGDVLDCELGVTMVWRGYKSNNGHYLKRTCIDCNYEYNVGYVKPDGHPNYFSVNNDCIYCQMPSPYYMEYDPNTQLTCCDDVINH